MAFDEVSDGAEVVRCDFPWVAASAVIPIPPDLAV